MRRKLARRKHRMSKHFTVEPGGKKARLTIGLSSLDLLQHSLEPTETRRITHNPEKLHTPQRAQVSTLLTVPDVLKNRRERGNTDSTTDKEGNLGLEHVLGGRTEGAINANGGKASLRVGDLREVTTDTERTSLLRSFHRFLCHGGDD